MALLNAGYVEYVTKSGDTFDMMAIAAYNDEKLASMIIQANPLHIRKIVFEEGVTLKIPVLEGVKRPSTLPPWRK